jgi:hypothetical protein
MHHLLPAVTSWWDDLGTPDVSAEVQAMLVKGVGEATDGATTIELAQKRDAALVRLLEARRPAG